LSIFESSHDEVANTFTHAIGVALAFAGIAVLVTLAGEHRDARRVVAYSIYGVTLVMLYAASTAYHLIRMPRAKRLLRTLDQAAIYLVIAGAYTPFALICLRGIWGSWLLGVMWALAATGVVSKLLFNGRLTLRVEVMLYLCMGSLPMPALFFKLPPAGMLLLVAGGLFCTVGVLFLALDHKRFHHAIWHVFVMAGSVCHFFAVLTSTFICC